MQNCRRCHLWVGCRWCEVDEIGNDLDTAFCGKRSDCYFGMVGHPGPYSGRLLLWFVYSIIETTFEFQKQNTLENCHESYSGIILNHNNNIANVSSQS